MDCHSLRHRRWTPPMSNLHSKLSLPVSYAHLLLLLNFILRWRVDIYRIVSSKSLESSTSQIEPPKTSINVGPTVDSNANQGSKCCWFSSFLHCPTLSAFRQQWCRLDSYGRHLLTLFQEQVLGMYKYIAISSGLFLFIYNIMILITFYPERPKFWKCQSDMAIWLITLSPKAPAPSAM